MAEPQEPNASAITPNFAHAMQSLAEQAEKSRPFAAASAPSSSLANDSTISSAPGALKNGPRQDSLLAIGQMLKPVAVGIESVTRLAMENRLLLNKVVASVTAPPPPPPAAPTVVLTAEQTQTFESIAQQLNRSATIESANQKLFDAMHAELKGYKDGFLFDAMQRPFIRDLISVHDELEGLHAQASARAQEIAAKPGAASDPFVATMAENLQNTLSLLLETFERLQVVPLRTSPGEPVDKRVHRVVAFHPVASQEQSGQVVHSNRPGFLWREGRCVRPEEVVASRWTPPGGSDANASTATQAPA